MGNNNSVQYSRKASRSGSINNPKEFIIQGRLQRKNSSNNLRSAPLDNDIFLEIDSERSSLNTSPWKLLNVVKKRSSSFSRDKINESDDIKMVLKEERAELHSKGNTLGKSKSFFIPKITVSSANQSPYSQSPRSPFSSRRKNSLPSNARERIEPLSFDEKTQFFVDELGFTDYKILYDTGIESFDTRTFNSKVLYQEDILCLLITNDGQFGFYQHEKMKNIRFGASMNQSSKFLIFSFKNTMPEPLILKRKPQAHLNSITTYPNNERNFMFTVHSAFWLTNAGKVHLHQMMKDFYTFNHQVINPFGPGNCSEKIDVNRMIVLQLSHSEYL